jgi:riboflavin biosynthesis pyrimidine reductase
LRELKAASDGRLGISGPGLAACALEWGEVDEVARYIVPVTVGGGSPWWPAGVEAQLELLEHQEVDDGWIFVRYRVLHPQSEPGGD